MTATSIAWSPDVEETVRVTRERHEHALTGRERLVGAPFGLALLLTAGVIALALPDPRALAIGPALALLAAFVFAARVELQTGAGYAVPTQMVFVPMVFLLPPALVPVLVGTGYVLARALQSQRPPLGPERIVGEFANAWYAVAPVLVIALADAEQPRLESLPVYAAALAAQFLLDAGAGYLRDKAAFGTSLTDLLGEMRFVHSLDAMLAPVGLLAAILAYEQPYAFLLVLPLVGLISTFGRERDALIDNQLQLARAYRGTALLLGEVVEGDDEYTGRHSRGVGLLALDVADELQLDATTRRDIEFAALLHDVGKVAMPKEIVNKPGSLTDEEWAVMRTHTIEGERMLQRVGGVLENVGTIVRASHERWDGGGYPDGLAGEQIPLAARIVSTCDAFSAITTDRPYRAARSAEEAVEELRACAGSQFDPEVVEALVRVVLRWTQETERPEAARSEQALDRLAAEVDRAAPLVFRRAREADVESFRELMDTLEDGIVLHDAEGVARDCNRSSEQILGVRAGDLRSGGLAMGELILVDAEGRPLADDAAPWRLALQTRRATGSVAIGIVRDGEITWLSAGARPLRRLGRARPHAAVTSFVVRQPEFIDSMQPPAVLMVNLHESDPSVLATARAVVRGRLRTTDVIEPITDDELCVLLRNTAPAEAVQVAGSLAGVLEIAGVRSTVRAGAMEVQKA